MPLRYPIPSVRYKFVLLLLLAAPWLSPWSPGPSPPVLQWLVSAACLACLLLLAPLSASESGQAVQYPSAHLLGRTLPYAWLLAALVSAAIGLVQYFGFSDALSGLVNRTAVGEAYGNLRQRNQFATLLNIGLAAALWIACAEGKAGAAADVRTFATRWKTLFLLASAALLAVANAASSSRTGLLQLLLLAGLAMWWSRGIEPTSQAKVRRLLLVAVAAYAVASVVLPWAIGLDGSVYGRFQESQYGCGSRLVLWSNVLHLIGQKPWLGWGWGELDYAHFITLYPGPRFCELLDNAHNLPLHLAVELGIPAAVLVCGLCVWLVLRGKPWAERNPLRQFAWAVLAVIGLHSMLEFPLWYGPFQMAALLCAYVLWQVPVERPGLTAQVPQALFRRGVPATVWQLAGILTIAACAYAGWDYRRVSQIYWPQEQRAMAYRDDTLHKIQGSFLFHQYVDFAELVITPLTPENAGRIYALAKDLLHVSPEPKIVKKLIDSAALLGKQDEAAFYRQRYLAAFPKTPL